MVPSIATSILPGRVARLGTVRGTILDGPLASAHGPAPASSGKRLPVPEWQPFLVVIVSYYFFALDFPRLYKNIKFLLIVIATGHPHFPELGRRSIGPIARHFDRRIDPLQFRSLLLAIVSFIITLSGASLSFAAVRPPDVPAWLRAHIGEGDGQIASVVLRRARALYLKKVSEGAVKNPCYFAMDATRPGELGRRFYVICESNRSFRAISAGHGSGRDLKGIADFANGMRCAKNFSNAMDSKLTTGGAYVTGETSTFFKGYYRVSAGKYAALIRSFVQFDGEGDAANARERAIGGHPAVLLRGICLRKDPDSAYADREGYVPLGTLVNYTGGRSNGCTSWSPSDAGQIIPMLKDKQTTLYIYPDSDDIDAVAQAVKAGRSPSLAGLYWNASCLKEIGSPKFWPKESLGPILAQYEKDHPAPPSRPAPICKGP
jgi:hypothetical protein